MLDAEWSRYVSKDEPRLAEFQAGDDDPRPVFGRDERRGGCLAGPKWRRLEQKEPALCREIGRNAMRFPLELAGR